MIPTLIILLLFGGNFGASHLDLSDPAVLAEFRKNVFSIVSDPNRAVNVTDAVYRLNVVSYQGRSANGVVEDTMQNFRTVASNYNATNSDVHVALRQMEHSLNNVTRGTIEGREVIRRNTTKGEWKALLKKLAN